MTTKDDIAASPDGVRPARRASKARARSRTPNRARTLLAAVLKKPGRQGRTTMICQSCELTGGPFAPEEAAHLLAVHEQMHHGGVSMYRPPLPPPT